MDPVDFATGSEVKFGNSTSLVTQHRMTDARIVFTNSMCARTAQCKRKLTRADECTRFFISHNSDYSVSPD